MGRGGEGDVEVVEEEEEGVLSNGGKQTVE